MKIGIDIDDTIVNTGIIEKEFIEKYKAEVASEQDFANKYYQQIYERATIKPGVKEALEWMRANDCKIIIITAREYFDNYCMQLFTTRLFEENNLPYDKIIIDSMPKGPDANREEIDLFFDDLESNLDSVSSYGIESIKVVNELTGKSKYKEFTNWYDILAYIKLRKSMQS